MVADAGQSPDELVTISSLTEFFHDSMDAALATNKLTLDDHTTHYVVNLLTLFSRSDALYERTDDGYQLRFNIFHWCLGDVREDLLFAS